MIQDNYKLKDLEKQFKDKTEGGHGERIVQTTDVIVRGGAACIYHPDKAIMTVATASRWMTAIPVCASRASPTHSAAPGSGIGCCREPQFYIRKSWR